MVTRNVRDYSNFDTDNFGHLLASKDCQNVDMSLDPDTQWEVILLRH